MSPTPASLVSLLNFWHAGGRTAIKVCDAIVLVAELVVAEVEEVEDMEEVEEEERVVE